MGKDFLCENTRAEFEAAYEEMYHRYGPESSRSEENTAMCDNTAESKSPRFDHFVFNPTHQVSGHQADNSAISDEVLSQSIPWQNIGDRLEHKDIYQRYTLDTRCVPKEYKGVVDALLRVDYMDNASLIKQGITAVDTPFSMGKEETATEEDYNKLKICIQDAINKKHPNKNVNNCGFSQAPTNLGVKDDNSYNFDKFVTSKLQAKLSDNVSQSNLNGPTRYTPEVHQSERRKENVLANQPKSQEVANKIDTQTPSKDKQRKKSPKETASSRAWRFVKNGLVLAGSVTAAALLFNRLF